jgi:hypothetical protein
VLVYQQPKVEHWELGNFTGNFKDSDFFPDFRESLNNSEQTENKEILLQVELQLEYLLV